MLGLKDQTHSRQIPEGERERDYIFIKPFLEIDVKGGERVHIKAKSLQQGEGATGGERHSFSFQKKDLSFLVFKEETSYMSLEGKDMFMLFCV